MKDRFLDLIAHLFHAPPAAVVIQRDPATFLGAIEPILVLLVMNEQAGRFPDVEDLIAVCMGIIKVSGGTLTHFTVQLVQFQQQ